VSYQLLYHRAFEKDLREINVDMQKRIFAAIETRLQIAPAEYGKPLQRTLKGFWKMRIGDYRLVYSVKGNAISIYGVIHRKKVYDKIVKRLTK